MLLNAMTWTGGRAVPEKGLISSRPTAEQLLNVLAAEGKTRNPGWTREALDALIEQINKPGKTFDWKAHDNRPLPAPQPPTKKKARLN